MHYLIAGGGDFGTRYLRKLNIARKRRNLPIESITVIDNNPDCKAKNFVERISRQDDFREKWRLTSGSVAG